MASLADKAILSGADNRPLMLEKDMYDSWKSRMELYMLNRVTWFKKYSELLASEAIQADCDVKAANIILRGLPPEVRLMNERTSDPLALISQHQLNKTPYQHHRPLYQQSQFQPQVTLYQSSPYGTTYHNFQFVSSGPSSLTHSISYPGTDTSTLVNYNAYMASSSAHQIAYAQLDQQSSEYSPPEAGLVIPVFQKGDDPIDAINHMMSFLTSVVASRYRATNNQF
nr:hypothetical protein [Tanacetum cinerariifolium]